MTMNMGQLRERVERQFPDAEQVNESVLRYTRTADDRPFAVYYLDIADDLPETTEALNEYQDQVIGSRYFEGRKSLQWSNYLYFLRSAEDLAAVAAQRAKELIETDRTYARKFVIPEDNLDDVLTPHTVAAAEELQQENVLSVWIELLSEANLERAILSDDDLPARLRKIETDPGEGDKETKPTRTHSVEPAQSIRSLALTRYRQVPLRRTFDFGTVNLIFGPNASGKTSLLEAIEYFYCGLNKRNPSRRPQYELDTVMADGGTQRATFNRRPQLFRDRNLAWYGQSEIKTNYLYKSFAQFNFLDTDAAVGLSDSTEQIEDDLSKLLVGPDTSKIWRDIERVGGAVSARLRDLQPHQRQMQTELTGLEKRLSEAADERRQSDSIRARLSEMTARHDWSLSADADEGFIENFVRSLTEMVSLAQQAVDIPWAGSPVTHAGLQNYCRAATELINDAEPKTKRLEGLKSELNRLMRSIDNAKQALNLTAQARRFIDAGVPDRIAERRNLDNAIVSYSNQLTGFEPEYLEILSTLESTEPVAISAQAATTNRSEADTVLKQTRNEYASFTRLRDESVHLAQQLRQIASAILEKSHNPDECPLCHTQFEPGELAVHMSRGLDDHLESLGQSLLSRIREQERALNNAKRTETAQIWLRDVCGRASMKSEATVGEAVAEVDELRDKLASARDRFQSLKQEIEQLEEAGLSLEELNRILSQLQNLGFPLEEFSRETVDQLQSSIDERASSLSQRLASPTEQTDALQTSLLEQLGTEGDLEQIKRAISRTNEQRATTETVVVRMAEFREAFPWPDDRSISELIVAGESVRRVASDMQTALVRERRASEAQSEALKRKGELEQQLATTARRIERFGTAQTVLKKIRREHSLSAAMESTLQLNRAAIESIFSSIHAPAEFAGLGQSLATLIRKSDGSDAKLTEISTGQRAAFGLSLFLAQNSQLTVAPPVILIDDPIAHVDDLNSLSFLDYLREIAITSRRQIFFATADDKLATLFERKFDFMGEEGFRRFNLTRKF